VRLPGRRSAVPADVLERAGLGRGEKVLASAVTLDGVWLLGGRDALTVVPPSTQTPTTRIPWQQVETADWDRDQTRLRVAEVADFGTPRPVHDFRAENPGLLLQLVRERVTASVLMQRRVTMSGRTGFFVIGRRAPDGRGDVSWSYRFDEGVDPDDPAVRDAAEKALATAAEELGSAGGPI
jgi:hypothetical protein